VICQDLFTEFEKNGLMNKDVAMRYRRKILEKGASQDAEDMVAEFLGRKYNAQAFKAWVNSNMCEQDS
jgi:thimet oligopeptidase